MAEAAGLARLEGDGDVEPRAGDQADPRRDHPRRRIGRRRADVALMRMGGQTGDRAAVPSRSTGCRSPSISIL